PQVPHDRVPDLIVRSPLPALNISLLFSHDPTSRSTVLRRPYLHPATRAPTRRRPSPPHPPRAARSSPGGCGGITDEEDPRPWRSLRVGQLPVVRVRLGRGGRAPAGRDGRWPRRRAIVRSGAGPSRSRDPIRVARPSPAAAPPRGGARGRRGLRSRGL